MCPPTSRRRDALRTILETLAPLLALGLVACGACAADRPFTTTSVYRSPSCDVVWRAVARGRVPAGHDHGEGIVEGRVVVPSSPPIDFRSDGRRLLDLRHGGHARTVADPHDLPGTFGPLLQELGRPCDVQELEELARVVEGLALGPKGTYLDGQTRHVVVEEVAFDRRPHDAPRLGALDDRHDIDGCSCTLADAGGVVMVQDDLAAGWVHLDGADRPLTLVRRTGHPGFDGRGLRPGDRFEEVYRAGDAEVRVDATVTSACAADAEACEVTTFAATLTLTRGAAARRAEVRGACGC